MRSLLLLMALLAWDYTPAQQYLELPTFQYSTEHTCTACEGRNWNALVDVRGTLDQTTHVGEVEVKLVLDDEVLDYWRHSFEMPHNGLLRRYSETELERAVMLGELPESDDPALSEFVAIYRNPARVVGMEEIVGEEESVSEDALFLEMFDVVLAVDVYEGRVHEVSLEAVR
ncbi:hypothetical protein GF402_11375 [Candidatus Fermentibacteria bacterium]|nr:hypothetical protein [Candidatus Fermentibacteria bacterium]